MTDQRGAAVPQTHPPQLLHVPGPVVGPAAPPQPSPFLSRPSLPPHHLHHAAVVRHFSCRPISGPSPNPVPAAATASAAPTPAAATPRPPSLAAAISSDREAATIRKAIGIEKVKVEADDDVEQLQMAANNVFPIGLLQDVKQSRKGKSSKRKRIQPDPGATEGDMGNSVLLSNNCRYDSSLGLLTKKFVDLLHRADDGSLDLNQAAEILEVQKRRIYDITNVLEGVDLIEKNSKNRIRWKGTDVSKPKEIDDQVATLKAEIESLHKEESRLDEMMSGMQDNMHYLRTDGNNRKLLYVTNKDITSIPRFQNSTLIAVNAPRGTSVEVLDPEESLNYPVRHYQFLLRSSMGPIDCFLISGHKASLSVSGREQCSASIDIDCAATSVDAVAERVTSCSVHDGRDSDEFGNLHKSSQRHDKVPGFIRIAPSDIDASADYWLSSNVENVSIGELFGT